MEDIVLENKFQNDDMRRILPLDGWSIPLGMVNWGILYLAICLVLLKRGSWAISMLPTLGLIATLLIATPLFYWQRYEAAAHFLIPFYIAIVILLTKRHTKKVD